MNIMFNLEKFYYKISNWIKVSRFVNGFFITIGNSERFLKEVDSTQLSKESLKKFYLQDKNRKPELELKHLVGKFKFYKEFNNSVVVILSTDNKVFTLVYDYHKGFNKPNTLEAIMLLNEKKLLNLQNKFYVLEKN